MNSIFYSVKLSWRLFCFHCSLKELATIVKITGKLEPNLTFDRVNTVSKPPWKKTLRNHSRISLRSTFFDSPSSPHDSFVSLPVVFLAVVVLFGNFAMMSLRFLLFSVIYVSSKAFKSCERQSLDHSESTASLLELVQVCLWCLQAAKYPI